MIIEFVFVTGTMIATMVLISIVADPRAMWTTVFEWLGTILMAGVLPSVLIGRAAINADASLQREQKRLSRIPPDPSAPAPLPPL